MLVYTSIVNDAAYRALTHILELAEVQLLFDAVFYIGILLVAGIVGIVMLHMMYRLHGSSPLYRHKPPDEEWDKSFYPASGLLIIVVVAASWVVNHLRHGIVPWT